MRLNREELAWAAGFFDGEGMTFFAEYKVTEYRRAKYNMCPGTTVRSIKMAISQAGEHAPAILARFRAAVGIGNIGNVYFKKKHPHYNSQWIWRVSRFETVQAVTAILWPFLSIAKRQQAKAALLAYLSVKKSPLTSERARAMSRKHWDAR